MLVEDAPIKSDTGVGPPVDTDSGCADSVGLDVDGAEGIRLRRAATTFSRIARENKTEIRNSNSAKRVFFSSTDELLASTDASDSAKLINISQHSN